MEEVVQREREFERLLQQHRAIVFKIANTYCWQPEDRADLAQEIALLRKTVERLEKKVDCKRAPDEQDGEGEPASRTSLLTSRLQLY